MEVESEYGDGKEKEVPPSPSHAVHGLIWVSPMQGNTLSNKNNCCVHTIQKCNSALIGH